LAHDKRAMARRKGELLGDSPWNTKTINGKNTADDDIPERDITDCTNPIYTIEQWQMDRAGGGQVGDFLCRVLFIFRALVLLAFCVVFSFFTGHNLKVA